MKLFKYLFLAVGFILVAQTELFAAPSQATILSELYTSTDGDNWANKTNWNNDDPCIDEWYGVECSEGNIVSLDLSYNNLSGTIPESIGLLTSLTRLYLHNNQLTGSIPVDIGNLTNLTYLNLEDNELTGSIPATIGNLTSLNAFYLNDNNLTGSIPTTIENMTSLMFLDFSINNLTGSIPTTIGNLTSLNAFYLQHNQLTGSIPIGIEYLTSLTRLSLFNNYLSGEIPTEIDNLTALQDSGGLRLETNCNLYSDDLGTQSFIQLKTFHASYEDFLATQGHCMPFNPVPIIMYLLN